MLSFFKKKVGGKRYRHVTKREDWESMVDALFVEVVRSWKHGLAVITNTTKRNGDARGEITENLSIRVKDEISPTVKSMLRRLDPKEFQQIFKLTQEQKGSDVFSIKNLGLPNNSLVYPISQKGHTPAGKKALLVFEGPYIKEKLSQKLEQVNHILSPPKRKKKGTSPKKHPQAVPAAIPKRDIHKTDIELIKTRLTYLEDADRRTPEETTEMENLKGYILHTMKQSFD